MACASVYGAEMSLAQAHPDWLLYDGTGRPMSLGNVFFIQDLSPDCGWRRQLLTAYQQALDLGFAGLQCDTYGSPRAGLTHDGRGVSLGAALPGLMAKAQALAADPVMGGAIVNCVRAWPLDIMAKAPGAAHYVEVWDPDETYRDLHELVLRARRLDPGRQLVLAAYLPAFHRAAGPPVGAMAGLRLAAAAIFAAGGFHLLMGEGSGVLADPYFPLYGCARRGERPATPGAGVVGRDRAPGDPASAAGGLVGQPRPRGRPAATAGLAAGTGPRGRPGAGGHRTAASLLEHAGGGGVAASGELSRGRCACPPGCIPVR